MREPDKSHGRRQAHIISSSYGRIPRTRSLNERRRWRSCRSKSAETATSAGWATWDRIQTTRTSPRGATSSSARQSYNTPSVFTPSCACRTCSSCEIIFRNEGDVLAAKTKVRSLHQQIQSELNHVWLDVRKSREELRPARLIHRATEILTEIEARSHHAKQVFKHIVSKCISVGDYKAFFTLKGPLKPSMSASMRYSETELSNICEYANSD